MKQCVAIHRSAAGQHFIFKFNADESRFIYDQIIEFQQQGLLSYMDVFILRLAVFNAVKTLNENGRKSNVN